jgi:DNA-binding response OmpR family regulator
LRPQLIETGNLQLDLAARQISVAGASIPIPRRELGILERLMTSFNRTITRSSLETAIYGAAGEICANSIEVRISRLRRLLARSGANVEIETLRGLGYRLQPLKLTQKPKQ